MKRKIKKIFFEVISNSKIFNIIFFNEIVNDQDFPKLTGGGTRQRGGDWTTSNTVCILLTFSIRTLKFYNFLWYKSDLKYLIFLKQSEIQYLKFIQLVLVIRGWNNIRFS